MTLSRATKAFPCGGHSLFLAFGFLVVATASAQGVVTTFAGTDFVFPRFPVRATDAPLSWILAIVPDGQGNLFLADDNNHIAARLTPDGTVSVYAGNGWLQASGDGGPARDASMVRANGLAVDPSGNLYIADYLDGRIRRVDANGIITTFAGNGTHGRLLDNIPATTASMSPASLVRDNAGNFYFYELGAYKIRRIAPDGTISTVVGTGTAGYSGDNGPAISARIRMSNEPFGNMLATDASGNLYIADSGNHVVRKVDSTGKITTVIGGGTPGYSADGTPVLQANLNYPTSLAFDPMGNLYIGEGLNYIVRRLSTTGALTTVAGNRQQGYFGDGGPATSARIGRVTTLYSDGSSIYLADADSGKLRRITLDGIINVIAGNGNFSFGGDSGPAVDANLGEPTGVAIGSDGRVYIADAFNNRIRVIDRNGVITTFAGDGEAAYRGDNGPANQASLADPEGVAVDRNNNVYIADSGNGVVRRVTPEGIITTFAGSANPGPGTGDGGPATKAALQYPIYVLPDDTGNVYIADADDSRIRKVVPDGTISTIAGNGNSADAGDGGPATSASFLTPFGLAFDAARNLYVSDYDANRIRRIAADGTIQAFAGNGKAGFGGDGGPKENATFNNPAGLAFDSAGALYIADSSNSYIRRIAPDGTVTIAAGYTGSHGGGLCCDGALAVLAIFSITQDVKFDAGGAMYIIDLLNNRLREVITVAPAFTVDRTSLRFSANAGSAPPSAIQVRVNGSLDGIRFSAAGDVKSAPWLKISPQTSPLNYATTPRLLEVAVDPSAVGPGDYTGTITVVPNDGVAPPLNIAVSFSVGSSVPSLPAVDKTNLSFNFPRTPIVRSQTLTVSNQGSGSFAATITAGTAAGGNWLSTSSSQVTVAAASPVTLSISVDSTGLSPGTYAGTIVVATAGSTTLTVPVTLTVSDRDQAALLSQTGLSFTGVQGGGIVPPQSFGVLNIGSGLMNWTSGTATIAGGSWLNAGPASGFTDASARQVPLVSVSVDPSSLTAGRYYGLVEVDSAGAANTPQFVTASLQVLPPDATPPAVTQPSSALFQSTAGSMAAGSQDILLYNLLPYPVSLHAGVASSDPSMLFILRPRFVSVSPRQPAVLSVFAYPQSSNPGTYHGTLSIGFPDGSVQELPLTYILSPATAASGAVAATSQRPLDPQSTCSATRLIPSLISLGQGSNIPVGWPAPITVAVKDDCGADLVDGSVIATFSNGDSPVTLQSLKNGTWQGTWPTHAAGSNITVTVSANLPAQNLSGTLAVSANLAGSTEKPISGPDQIVSRFNPIPYVPIAPGSQIAINGSKLASADGQALAAPLPVKLNDTQVSILGRPIPLVSATDQQILAIVPTNIPVNVPLPLIVQRGLALSDAIIINAAPAQPAVLLDSGTQITAVITRATATGQVTLRNAPGAPAAPGDAITLYCAGLGLVTPSVDAASAAPTDVLTYTVSPVTLTIGGVAADVKFAGLVPGAIDLYEVVAIVPDGIPAGDAIPVLISVANQLNQIGTLATATPAR
jgi:uncharacterized protein (TIGR03437 family)